LSWLLPQIGPSIEKPSNGFRHVFFCRCLVVHVGPTRTGELKPPLAVEGVHTTGCCPVPRGDRLRHCCHHLSDTQFPARCSTPWLRWTTALFAVLGRYPLRDEDTKGWYLGGARYMPCLPWLHHLYWFLLLNNGPSIKLTFAQVWLQLTRENIVLTALLSLTI
jgi:hypothetical protein